MGQERSHLTSPQRRAAASYYRQSSIVNPRSASIASIGLPFPSRSRNQASERVSAQRSSSVSGSSSYPRYSVVNTRSASIASIGLPFPSRSRNQASERVSAQRSSSVSGSSSHRRN